MYSKQTPPIIEIVESERRINGDEDASQLYFMLREKEKRLYN
jgi:hypothetical protein